MIKVSLCMIVKDEEQVLERCLSSLCDLMDEIIIVDTGSSDGTKDIARRYTDQIYDFEWCDDFSAARNFAFSKATQDYIYSADADEVLDEENRRKFRELKECLLPEIEIVQMHYLNKTQHNTTENFEAEYRPKLYKRLRTFLWINPIHETVNLTPVVFDSDITVLHMPENAHGRRDFGIFLKAVKRGDMPSHLVHMYARELMIAGAKRDFDAAADFFKDKYKEAIFDEDSSRIHQEAACVLARYYRLNGEPLLFLNICLKDSALGGCSEVCRELGFFYEEQNNYEEAALWYYNAAFETQAALDATSSATSGAPGRQAELLLGRLYEKWSDSLKESDPQKAVAFRMTALKYLNT